MILKKRLLIMLAFVFIFSGCADVEIIDKCVETKPYGFWWGLWHGMIAPISFVFSLFSDEIAMYGVNNTGGWYDFGFVLGAGILFGGGGKVSKKK